MSAMNSIPSGYKVNGCGATRESTVGYKQTEVGVIFLRIGMRRKLEIL